MNFVNYIRQLIGFGGDDTATRPSYKRDRLDEDLRDDEEAPAFKRLKQLSRTRFPDVLTMNEGCDRRERSNSKVRYVPIQLEAGHPSTSTPNTSSELPSRSRTVPVRLVDVSGIGTEEIRRPRIHTPLKPAAHAVIEDDDDDNDVTWIETTKPQSQKLTKQQKIYINLDEEDDDNDEQDNVIFVKKVASPKPPKPYKFFVTKNNESSRKDEGTQYYKLMPQSKLDRNVLSPRSATKFKAPAGISKGYKRLPTPVPKWMQPLQPLSTSNMSQARNNYLNLNGNVRSAISESFNLNEKRNYQELIRRVAASSKPFSLNKADEVINLADDAASFRSTIRSQKKSLDEIKLLEKGLQADRESESTREYDPVTVASINSSDSEPEVIPSGSSTSSSVRITPINTLRDSFKDRAVISDDWLSKLESKYKKKKEATQEKLKDARRESNIIHKVNYEQKLALLEHKLKHDLCIPESLIEEVQPTVELPELTPEQEKLVNRALGPGPPGQLLVEKFNLRITRRDLQTLAGLNWLNDEVINFYMNLLMQRSEERSDLPKVYAANTFFYPKLMQSGQAGLKRWTRKVDIFAHDLMVIPVHLGVHWCVCLVDLSGRAVRYLDSMGGNNPKCLSAVLQYLRDEHQDKKGKPLDHAQWKTECISKNIPQQMNGSDCGMFSCTFAEFAARGAPFSFSQQHMPYLRKKMALEILQGKLLL